MKKLSTFIVGLALTLSYSLNAADIVIDPTASLSATYTSATEGDVIILGDGSYTVDATISLTKGITIKAQNALMATVVGTGFTLSTPLTTDVTFQGIIFDGKKTVDQVMQLYFTDINGGTSLNNVSIENCKILNYGNCLIRGNRAEGVLNTYKVNNCYIQNMGYSNAYPFFQMTKTKVTKIEFTNNTVADLSNEFIQFYGTVGGNNDAVILFKNNTFYNVVVNSARTPMSGKSGKVYVQNNIFVKSPVHGVKEIGFDATVTTVELTNNVINDFAGGAFLSAAGWLVSTGNTDADPLFKDVVNYDFTLPDTSALITANIGDPRWFPVKTATKNIQSDEFSVVNNIINFNKPTDVQIFNLTGKMIQSANQTLSVNLNNIQKGIYLIHTNQSTNKVVVL